MLHVEIILICYGGHAVIIHHEITSINWVTFVMTQWNILQYSSFDLWRTHYNTALEFVIRWSFGFLLWQFIYPLHQGSHNTAWNSLMLLNQFLYCTGYLEFKLCNKTERRLMYSRPVTISSINQFSVRYASQHDQKLISHRRITSVLLWVCPAYWWYWLWWWWWQ